MKNIFSKIKKIKKTTWILLAIIAVGIFLRTYNFRDWLYFGADQAHDALVSGNAAIGKTPWPLLGADMGNTNFHLGPMYYYFQIISAKIFGNNPEAMAYPDLLFSILTIPLFYFFLKKYFNDKISLTITGLYAISFYVIRYSRFAWNPNPIPFFTILFLFSLLEFLDAKEKTRWIWIILIGISIGVGIQLHAILMIIMSATASLVFIFLMKKNWRVWNKWVIILLVVLTLNLGQIASEVKTNYTNSKIFLSSFTDRSQSGEGKFLENLESNIDCHVQANFHIASSLGNKDNCTFYYTNLLEKKGKAYSNIITKEGYSPFVFMFLAIIFSFIIYGLFFYYIKNEDRLQKKYFLRLIALYLAFYFAVMTFSISAAPLRYFVPVAFAPFILLGLLLKFLITKYPKKNLLIIILFFLFFATTNLISIKEMFGELSAKIRSSYKYVVLGEIEKMMDYMISQSDSKEGAYLVGNRIYVSNFYRSLMYVGQRRGFSITRADDSKRISPGNSVFYITASPKNEFSHNVRGNKFDSYKDFGKVSIYKLVD